MADEPKENDVIKEMLESLEHQAREISKKVKSKDVIIGASAGDDKSFDHVMTWGTKAVDFAENIQKLRQLLKGGTTELPKEEEKEGEHPLVKNAKRYTGGQ